MPYRFMPPLPVLDPGRENQTPRSPIPITGKHRPWQCKQEPGFLLSLTPAGWKGAPSMALLQGCTLAAQLQGALGL